MISSLFRGGGFFVSSSSLWETVRRRHGGYSSARGWTINLAKKLRAYPQEFDKPETCNRIHYAAKIKTCRKGEHMSWFDKLLPPRIQRPRPQKTDHAQGLWVKCPSCKAALYRTISRETSRCVRSAATTCGSAPARASIRCWTRRPIGDRPGSAARRYFEVQGQEVVSGRFKAKPWKRAARPMR